MFCSWLARDRRKGPEPVMQYPAMSLRFTPAHFLRLGDSATGEVYPAKAGSVSDGVTNIVILVYILFRENKNAINARVSHDPAKLLRTQ